MIQNEKSKIFFYYFTAMAKILIIDDERFIRASLREILEYEKYEVIEAQDGAEGLQKIKDEEVDLVLCDIKMPILDGMDVLDQVKQLEFLHLQIRHLMQMLFLLMKKQ